MSKLYTHKEFGGLYDWDGENLTKVLKIYEGNIPRFRIFSYQMCKDNYRKATKEDIRKFRLNYYNDNGIQCLYKYNLRKPKLIYIDSIGCVNKRYRYEDKEFKIVDFDVEKVKYEVLEQL
jgi:hypothetical protein